MAWRQTSRKRWPTVMAVRATSSHRAAVRWPKRQAEAEHHHPLGPLHEAALAVEAEALGPGPLVGDEQREHGHGEGQDGEVGVAPGVVPGGAAQDDAVGHPVADRVEEGAPGAGGAARLGHRPVEHVGQPGEGEEEGAPAEVAGGDGQATGQGGGQAQQRDLIGADPDLSEAGAERGGDPARPPPASVYPASRVPRRRSRASSAECSGQLPVAPVHAADTISGHPSAGLFTVLYRGPDCCFGGWREDVPLGQDPQCRPRRATATPGRPPWPRRSSSATG